MPKNSLIRRQLPELPRFCPPCASRRSSQAIMFVYRPWEYKGLETRTQKKLSEPVVLEVEENSHGELT